MRKYLTCDEQLDKLAASGLIIKDIEKAKEYLQSIGYYNLINGYSEIFKYNKKIDGKKGYKNNATFDDVVNLYNFDTKLRSLVFEYTSIIERYFKETMAHIFSRIHGVDQEQYLTPECFSSKDSDAVKDIIKDSKDNIEKARKKGEKTYRAYLDEHFIKYGHIPFWVLIRTFSFGKAKFIFRNLIETEQDEIARKYKLSVEKFKALIEIAVAFRNTVAHGERLFCTQLFFIDNLLSTDYSVVRKLQIPLSPVTGKIMYGRMDFVAFLITCKYLLSADDFNLFFSEFEKLINELKGCYSESVFISIMEKMNLQRKSWKNLPKIALQVE